MELGKFKRILQEDSGKKGLKFILCASAARGVQTHRSSLRPRQAPSSPRSSQELLRSAALPVRGFLPITNTRPANCTFTSRLTSPSYPFGLVNSLTLRRLYKPCEQPDLRHSLSRSCRVEWRE